MVGGLARRAGVIKRIRDKNQHLLLVDAGNALFEKYSLPASDLPLAAKKADFILESYLKMGYQAINIGLRDWAGGGDYLLQAVKEGRYPFVSANLSGQNPGGLLPRSTILDFSGCKVGIVGAMSTPSSGIRKLPDIAVNDPVPAIREVVNRLKKECAFVVLLSDLGQKNDIDIAKTIDGINVIIGSGTGSSLRFAAQINNTYLCRPQSKGQSLGRLDVTVTAMGVVRHIEHRILPLDDSMPEDKEMLAGIEELSKE